MTAEIEVEELGTRGRLLPSPEQLEVILGVVRARVDADAAATAANKRQGPRARAALWRFSGRGWGNHPADRRSRPQHSGGF